MQAVVYLPEIATDRGKLFACYSLVQQMIDEHNRQGAIARSDWETYKDGWKEYSQTFHDKFKWVLHEQNLLMDKIRKANYTDKEWQSMTDDERDIAEVGMFGDKEVEKVKPTLATSPLLDELKTVKLKEAKIPIREDEAFPVFGGR